MEKKDADDPIINRIRLLCSIFRCRRCFPLDIDLSEPCDCVHATLREQWIHSGVPDTLLPLVSSYLLESVNTSFITSPLLPSYGIVQCKIIVVENKYELCFEMKEHTMFTPEYQNEDAKAALVRKIGMGENLFDCAETLIRKGKDVHLLSCTKKYRIHMPWNKKMRPLAKLKYTKDDKDHHRFTLKHNHREAAAVLVRFPADGGAPMRVKILLPNREFHNNNKKKKHSFWSRKPKAPSILTQFAKQKTENESKVDEVNNVTTNMETMANEGTTTTPIDSKGDEIEVYENLMPLWNPFMSCYALRFDNNRVEFKSMSNMKVVRLNDLTKSTILQLGKLENEDGFIMDVQYPMSILQAFATALSVIVPRK